MKPYELADRILDKIDMSPECYGDATCKAILDAAQSIINELTGWQPIGTAPSDGTLIDIYNEYGRQADCIVCPQFKHIYQHDIETNNYSQKIYGATHWRQLPAPPTQNKLTSKSLQLPNSNGDLEGSY